jgi:hypothetical protein
MIPNEIWYQIFSFLGHPLELFKVKKTCVNFSAIIDLLINDHGSFASTLISFLKKTGSLLITGNHIIDYSNVIGVYYSNESEPLLLSIDRSLELYKKSECFCQYDSIKKQLQFIFISDDWIPNPEITTFSFTKDTTDKKDKIHYLEYLTNRSFSPKYRNKRFNLIPTHNNEELITLLYDNNGSDYHYYFFHKNHSAVIFINSKQLLRLKLYRGSETRSHLEFYFVFTSLLCFLKFTIDYTTKNITDLDLIPLHLKIRNLMSPVFVHHDKFYSFDYTGRTFLLESSINQELACLPKLSDLFNVSFCD